MADKTKQAQPQSKPLTEAQAERMLAFVEELKDAEARVRTALKQAEYERYLVQRHANEFLAYCAKEHGVTLGQDGWTFQQNTLSFVQLNSNGKEA